MKSSNSKLINCLPLELENNILGYLPTYFLQINSSDNRWYSIYNYSKLSKNKKKRTRKKFWSDFNRHLSKFNKKVCIISHNVFKLEDTNLNFAKFILNSHISPDYLLLFHNIYKLKDNEYIKLEKSLLFEEGYYLKLWYDHPEIYYRPFRPPIHIKLPLCESEEEPVVEDVNDGGNDDNDDCLDIEGEIDGDNDDNDDDCPEIDGGNDDDDGPDIEGEIYGTAAEEHLPRTLSDEMRNEQRAIKRMCDKADNLLAQLRL